MPELNPETLDHEEEVELVLKVMADGPLRDFEAGQRWLRSQRRLIVIRERDDES
jgi:hypothetical protein